MARWDSNAVGRLQEAAIALYRKPGYDKVTVAEIAERAGLTRRTFFRYFPDKREVLFAGAERLELIVTEGIMNAPEGTAPFAMAALALAPIARLSDDDPSWADYVRQRHEVIQAHAELRERELAKHALLASVLASALRRRGVKAGPAKLAAEAALLAFNAGFESWFADTGDAPRKMATHIREATRALAAVVRDSRRGRAT